jgi:hypothetical protein
MKVIESTLRAVIERVTEIEIPLYGENKRLFVFENLDRKGNPCKFWIQNWECDDITDTFSLDDRMKICAALREHYKCAANTK